jgi:hypothetical protein
LGVLLAGISAGWSCGQVPIQWSSAPERSVQFAQRTLRPLLFYIPNNEEDNELEDAQQVTFRDPLVVGIVSQRFVPVRLNRSTDNFELMRQWGTPTTYGMYLVITTPGGDLIGTIKPYEAASAPGFARELTNHFRKYRTMLLEDRLRPILEDGDARPADIQWALRMIRDFLITEADEHVVALLESRSVTRQLRPVIFDTLATLGTEKSIETLFSAALLQSRAAQALYRAPAGALDFLLPELELDNERERMVLAYNAIARIAGLRQPKPEMFWKGPNERLKREELARVRALADRQYEEWEARFAAIR